MQTQQGKESNVSEDLHGFSRVCFPQPILASNILCKNKSPGELTYGERLPLKQYFRLVRPEPTAGFLSTGLSVSLLAHMYTHLRSLGILIENRCHYPQCQPRGTHGIFFISTPGNYGFPFAPPPSAPLSSSTSCPPVHLESLPWFRLGQPCAFIVVVVIVNIQQFQCWGKKERKKKRRERKKGTTTTPKENMF